MTPEYHQAYGKKHYRENRDAYAKQSKAWREQNKERANQLSLDYYYRNRDKRLVEQKQWRDSNKEYLANYQREYVKLKGRAYFSKLRNDYDHRFPEARLLTAARATAKKRHLPFNLEREDIAIPTICSVLGIEIRKAKGPRTDNSPSLDRIIPALGYVKGNVIVISWRANRLKQDASIEELRKIADFYQRIAQKD